MHDFRNRTAWRDAFDKVSIARQAIPLETALIMVNVGFYQRGIAAEISCRLGLQRFRDVVRYPAAYRTSKAKADAELLAKQPKQERGAPHACPQCQEYQEIPGYQH